MSSPFAPVHFREWYPFLGPAFASKIEPGGQCAPQYQEYLANDTPCPVGVIDCLAENVVNCLLNSITQTTQANQQAAAILLGLLPVMLAMASSTTLEIGLIAFRRPLLAFLLSLGSLSVNPIRAFDYRNIVHHLGLQSDVPLKSSPKTQHCSAFLVSTSQYLLIAGAIANVGLVTRDLSLKTVSTLSLSSTFLPALWVSTAAAIICLGVLAFTLRVGLKNATTLRRERTVQRLSREFKLNSNKSHCCLYLREETYLSIVLNWLVAIFIIAHLAYGTLLLSSLLFIGTRDAAVIAVRLFGSTLICRAILMYELSGLRERVTFEYATSDSLITISGASESAKARPLHHIPS